MSGQALLAQRMDAFMKERLKVYTEVGRCMGLGK